MEELEIISTCKYKSIILIDDARLFYGPPLPPQKPEEWPSISEIFKLFDNKFKNNINTIRDDFILSYPKEIKDIFDKEWSERFYQRYPPK